VGHSFEKELDVAIRAVELASALCESVSRDFTVEARLKADQSPVTIADYGSQAIVCRTIAEDFPEDLIVAEEDAAELRNPEGSELLGCVAAQIRQFVGGATNEQICNWIDLGGATHFSKRFWTLDPIDGTKGFLRREQYAVALALIIDGDVKVAVLGCPNLRLVGQDQEGLLAYSVRGRGAFCRDLSRKKVSTIMNTSMIDEPRLARFCESVESGHSAHDESARITKALGFLGAPRRLDSQAKYAVVAAGEAEVYLRLPTRADYREKIWDHAAGSLIIEEAGGRVTDIQGRPLDFSKGRELSENRGIVATNARLHDRVLAAIRG
jgi:HAL2 family 3'(2'),5'-bisphosphate nucleotidase